MMKFIYLVEENALSNGKEEEHPENVDLLGPKVLYRPQKEKDTKTLQIEVCI